MAEALTNEQSPYTLKHLSPCIGTEVLGIDLQQALPQATIDWLSNLLVARKVLFFRDQPMDEEQHLKLARRFGTPQGPGSIPQPKGYPMIRHLWLHYPEDRMAAQTEKQFLLGEDLMVLPVLEPGKRRVHGYWRIRLQWTC